MASSTDTRPAAINEPLVLTVLALVQFTHVMDFMIMMPLGPRLMRSFAIAPAAFSHLVAAYGIAAACSGFLAAFFMDRFDRKRALVFLYAGFGLGTLLCALAPGYWTMLFARVVAGGFGGVAGSVVVAIIGDVIPGERRGRAMGVVSSSFSVASIVGVPTGLWLANRFEWHAPFFLLAACSAIILVFAARALPPLQGHLRRTHAEPWAQMRALLGHRDHRRGLLVSFLLVCSGAVVFPFLAPSMVANAGLPESRLPFIYLCGGACTLVSMNVIGRLSDRFNKLRVLAVISLLACLGVLVITRLPPVPIAVALTATSFFMVAMSGRFTPAMAMITNAVEPHLRGGFMSINTSIQQIAVGLSALLAGSLVHTADSGRLTGYPRLGLLSVVCLALTVFFAWRLCVALPVAARAGKTASAP